MITSLALLSTMYEYSPITRVYTNMEKVITWFVNIVTLFDGH